MNVFELIKEKLHKWDMQDLYLPTHFEDIVDEVAQEYNNGWIPCSERLPEEDKYVLCSGVHTQFVACIDSLDGKWRDRAYHTRTTIKAWQPLPAPYKEGHTDEYIKGYNQGTIDRANEIQKAREYGYNKALDDVRYMLNDVTYNISDAEDLFDSIVEILEQLKGGSND